ncbi:MAG: copper amine oxidase N-terminal domain-containing protein [Firmicutes bacterium]|nr:copper amine oxidase N-terminal domain-containing protein [Bacillota bacterium]
MKKKIITATLTLALAAGICGSVYAAEKAAELQVGNPVMKVNLQEQTIDAPPVIVNGRTLVPVRAVVEALDGTVDWDAETKTAKLVSGDNTIELTIDSTAAKLNGEEAMLDVAPTIMDGRTMLPIRFVAESFGFYTYWDAETKTVYVAKIADAKEEEEEDAGGYAFYHTSKEGSMFVEMEDRTFAYDKNDEVIGEFLDTFISDEDYTDKDGKKLKFVYDDNEISVVDASGKKSKLTVDESLIISDKDNNTYSFFFGDGYWSILVKNSKGELVNELKQGDSTYYYKAEDGKELTETVSRFGDEPYIGYTLPDGTFIKCDRDYDTIYTDESGNLYGDFLGWMTELKSDGTIIKDYRPMDSYDILINDDKTESYLYSGKEYDYVIRSADGKEITLKITAEKEDDTIYQGSDGKTYTAHEDFSCTVKDKDGNESKLNYGGYERTFKAKDGSEMTVRYVDDDYILTKADGTKTKITASEGVG